MIRGTRVITALAVLAIAVVGCTPAPAIVKTANGELATGKPSRAPMGGLVVDDKNVDPDGDGLRDKVEGFMRHGKPVAGDTEQAPADDPTASPPPPPTETGAPDVPRFKQIPAHEGESPDRGIGSTARLDQQGQQGQTKGTDKRDKREEPTDGRRVHAAQTTSLGGKLSPDQVDAVVAANLTKLTACTKADTTVTLRATVSVDGHVVEVSAPRSTPDDPRMRDCVTSAFRDISFPRIDGEWPSRLTFDLRLEP